MSEGEWERYEVLGDEPVIWLAGVRCLVGVCGASETGPCPRTGDSGPCLAGDAPRSSPSLSPPPRDLRVFTDLARLRDLNMVWSRV